MNKLEIIGLDQEYSNKINKKLNELLANYSIFYQNTRGYHWNIKGKKFFELHIKFEELYNDQLNKIDEIAERIVTVGDTPEHNYSAYFKVSTIKESKDISNGIDAVQYVLDTFSVIIAMEREILELSAKGNDEGTNAMMSDYIREQEKLVWMYSSFLTN